MTISLEELLSTIARGATRAQWEVKEEERRHFAALFTEDNDGNLTPTAFTLKLLEHKALVPWLNMMHQDQFSIKRLELDFKTSVNVTTNEEGKILIDCTLKKGLLQHGTDMRIKMDLESHPPTEGIEQIRDYFAHTLSDSLKGISQGEKDADER